MTRRWRRISIWVGLTAYVFAVSCGDWLHTHDHGKGAVPGEAAFSLHQAPDHDHDDHDHGAPGLPSDEDCSICRFHAQQPLAAQVVIFEGCLGPALETLRDFSPQAAVAAVSTHHSRAPPANV